MQLNLSFLTAEASYHVFRLEIGTLVVGNVPTRPWAKFFFCLILAFSSSLFDWPQDVASLCLYNLTRNAPFPDINSILYEIDKILKLHEMK